LADIFHNLGLSGEDGWRAAARVRFLLHRRDPLSRELSPKEWQEPDIQWLTGTHTAEHVRYFNQESHEELLWWIQVPSLVAASPAQQRTAAQQSFAAINAATQAAQDAGFRLDRLLPTGTTDLPRRNAPATKRKPAKAGGAEGSTKTEAKSAGTPNGARKNDTAEKTPTKKAKKQPAKKSTSSKRKP